MKLSEPVSKIPAIGPKYKDVLEVIGIYTIQDLLYYFPRDYFDSSLFFNITELDPREKRTFKAEVVKFNSIRVRGRKLTIQTAIVEDETGHIELVFFNQPFLKESLKAGETYIFSGKLNPKSYKAQVQSPNFESVKDVQTHVGIITPIYPLTQGLSNKWLRERIKWLTDKLDYVDDLEETLDKQTIKENNLKSLKFSLKNIHFPGTQEELEQARHRLGFEELFNIQLKIQKRKLSRQQLKGPEIKQEQSLIKKFVSKLEFNLTQDQENAIKEVEEDFESGRTMNRLLSGDVGSGKTIVAIVSSLLAAKSGYQTAILAPTTVLADQHFSTFNKLLEGFGLKTILVSSNSKVPEEDIKTADIVIGTHAILFKKFKIFKKLGLIIIDEQHKFGVEQRRELSKTFFNKEKGIAPHLLALSATPIPRTLALSLFGDLDVSQIKSKPKLRKATKTHLVPENKREDALKWLNQKAKEGVQIFWIAPLIEESEKLDIKSTKKLFEQLQNDLPDLKIELLHGKLKAEEKQKILEKFKNFEKNKINILVSTSVIEVGIDIPNANIIVIEAAERFGLAQLHQLRGRVGRSDQESWCFLFPTTEPNEKQQKRLEYFCENSDGFKLAEFDLHSRGPGEVYGTKQSGIPNLKIANIFDTELLKETKNAAEKQLKSMK